MSVNTTSRWIKVALFVICFVVIVTGWILHDSLEKPVQVTVASPAIHDVSNLVTTNGDVEPLQEFQARANFPGMIDKVLVELGDKVQPGQMLVTMKGPRR